jgi:putative PIN family toxin of toxin-antitoxin system
MPSEKMRVVLDTNVILNALSPKLGYRSILQDIILGKYELFITSEVLLEYEEKIDQFYGSKTASLFLDALTASSHVHKIEVFFRFNLLSDFDDNKFLDCAFAANAHFLVSEDKGFHVLSKLEFPKIQVISLEKFFAMLQIGI